MSKHLDITTVQYVPVCCQSAQLSSRIFALAIDRIIQTIVAFTIISNLNTSANVVIAITIVSTYIINLLLEYFLKGQTIGKWIMRIRVVGRNGEPPTFTQCLSRWAIYSIDFWLVGAIMIENKSQRLGDVAADCYVVYTTNKSLIKTSLNKHYQYLEANYQPYFKDLSLMTDDDDKLIKELLYNDKYTSQRAFVSERLQKELRINWIGLNYKRFLITLSNDYNYYKYHSNDEVLH